MQVYPAKSPNHRNSNSVPTGSDLASSRLERFIRPSSILRNLAMLLLPSFVTINALGINVPPSTPALIVEHRVPGFLGVLRLPPSSELLFRATSLFGDHRLYILGGLLFLLVETALIAVLLLEKRRGRRSQVLLARRFAIEQVISEYSTRLSEYPPAQVESECKNLLQAVINAEEMDGAAWAEIHDPTKTLRIVCYAERAEADSMFTRRDRTALGDPRPAARTCGFDR